MTIEKRLELYQILSERIGKDIFTICGGLTRIKYSYKQFRNISIHLKDYPELEVQTPSKLEPLGFWYPIDKEGTTKRHQNILLAIEKCKQMISSSQNKIYEQRIKPVKRFIET